jgi:hypothetical protein
VGVGSSIGPPLRERQLSAYREALMMAAKITWNGLLVIAATLFVFIMVL